MPLIICFPAVTGHCLLPSCLLLLSTFSENSNASFKTRLLSLALGYLLSGLPLGAPLVWNLIPVCGYIIFVPGSPGVPRGKGEYSGKNMPLGAAQRMLNEGIGLAKKREVGARGGRETGVHGTAAPSPSALLQPLLLPGRPFPATHAGPEIDTWGPWWCIFTAQRTQPPFLGY